MKTCTPWREAHFEVKMCNTHQHRSTFGSWDVEKAHAVVARGTFRSPKCKKLTVSDHFWKLRCRKSARRCGAKHISKSKCERHHMLGQVLDVQMSFRVAGARDCAPCQKWAKREGLLAASTTTTTTLRYTPLHYTTTTTRMNYSYDHNYSYNTLRYTTLISLHYATPTPTPHYTTLH